MSDLISFIMSFRITYFDLMNHYQVVCKEINK
jgi:hypothetical protein